MTLTAGDFLVQRLYEWGERRIYDYPGDGIDGVFGALNRSQGKIESIQAHHEEMAAFMATAHAQGDPDEAGIIVQAARQVMSAVLPKRKR